jgi:hypothetical protein
MNKTELFIQFDSNWISLDLSDNVPFPITYNIADFRDIASRNSAYTKTIILPGTKNNNEILKYIFDIQSIDTYDTRLKVKCNSVVNTVPIFEGFFKLNKINCDDNSYYTYEVNIYSENANFIKELDSNITLRDLDFSDYDHIFNIMSITQSWTSDSIPYFYGIYDVNTGSNIDFVYNASYMRPSIYTRSILYKIFNNLGYSIESEFLDSSLFRSTVIPSNNNIMENTLDFRFNSTFRAGLTSSQVFVANPPKINPLTSNAVSYDKFGNFNFNDTISPSGDPGNNFNITYPVGNITDPYFDTFLEVNAVPNNYENFYESTINKKIRFNINLNWRFRAYKNNVLVTDPSTISGTGLLCTLQLLRVVGGVSTLVSEETVFFNNLQNSTLGNNANLIASYGQPSPITSNLLTSLQSKVITTPWFGSNDVGNLAAFQPNEKLFIRLRFYRNAFLLSTITSAPFFDNDQETRFEIEFLPQTFQNTGTFISSEVDNMLLIGQPIDLTKSLPGNIKQVDFLNSLIKTFNLYFYQDKINPKKIFIEPRDQFYTSEYVDWSRKLDISKPIENIPIVNRKKRVILTFKDDKDLYNTDYKGHTNETYGRFEYDTGNQIDNSIEKIETMWSPTPLSNPHNNDAIPNFNWIVSRIYDNKPVTEETRNRLDHNIRILFRKMITPFDGSKFRLARNSVSISEYNQYPYIGHLDDPFEPTFDLNFGQPNFLFFKTPQDYIYNNLYTEYYSQHFEEIYGNESRAVSAYFAINSQDINDLDFRKLVYIDNISSGSPGYFRINKIEYDPQSNTSFKVELLKVLNNFKKVPIIRLVDSVGGFKRGLSIATGVVTPGFNQNVGNNNLIVGEFNISEGNNVIIGGSGNFNQGSNNLLTGTGNFIGSDNSAIIGGSSNRIDKGGDNSVIIGGIGIKNSQSNVVLIGSILIENIDIVSASIDEVLNPFSMSPPNIVSGSINKVRQLGSYKKESILSGGFLIIDGNGNSLGL